MKTRLLIIIGICTIVITTIILGAIFMSERNNQRELLLDQSSLATDTIGNCGEKYMVVGNNECVFES